MTKKGERGLGRGLESLFSSNWQDNENEIAEIDVEMLMPRQNQPRKDFNQEALASLAESVKKHGVLQPVLLKPVDNGMFEIIAGERRWRAVQLAGLKTIPALVRDFDDKQVSIISLVENLQREDLSVIEEAQAYKEMLDTYGCTHEELAAYLGKSRTYITNTIRLLNLPSHILELLTDGKISAGHARALLSVDDSEYQQELADRITSEAMSVRDLEKKIRMRKPQKSARIKSADICSLEEKLQRLFGTKVDIKMKKKGGRIEVDYYDNEDLNRIIEILGI